ncbi:hypothetical protein DQ04_01091020 [Trypanosoma grayi]|uniref:hypothetical protein n=1 Tax=Trypanosoma grayi TaxID=71804 RepID=UPI0004F44C34|nr:hypothetical protein DQ04_01091020 [Trypanosoma grayi]KEG13295.1 hypothetical protein DQ04_01091020 [Trypanosoma grayi]
MLEEATPRAQLHLQRILTGLSDGPNGDTSAVAPMLVRSSPPRHIVPKGRINMGVPQMNTQSHRVDTRDRASTGISAAHSSSGSRVAMARGYSTSPQYKTAATSPRAKASRALVDMLDYSQDSDLRRHSPSHEISPQSVAQRPRRIVGVPRGKLSVFQDFSTKGTEAEDAATPVRFCGSTFDSRRLLQQIGEEERIRRHFIEEVAASHIEGMRQAKCYGEVLLRLLKDAATTLTQVSRFVRTPAEEVVRNPEWHLTRVRDVTQQEAPMNVKDMLFCLQRIPATMAANYERLMSAAHGVSEVEEPMPMLSIPQPHPPQHYLQQQQHQNLASHEANLYVRRPSSLFSWCGGMQPVVSRPCQSLSGPMSPHGPGILNGSFESVDEMPSTSTFMANMVTRHTEREVDAAWAVEDLQEETVYWQEEALRAMSEAERYLQMAYTVLGWPLSGPQNGGGELGPRRMSVTAMGSPSQRLAVHCAFVELLQKMEEGGRSKIEAQETQGWLELRSSIWNTHCVCNCSGTNGDAEEGYQQLEKENKEEKARKGDNNGCVQSSDRVGNASRLFKHCWTKGVAESTPSKDNCAVSDSDDDDELPETALRRLRLAQHRIEELEAANSSLRASLLERISS